MVKKKKFKGIEFEEGSGNVFADLGLPDADELFARAQLGFVVYQILSERNLKQREMEEMPLAMDYKSLLFKAWVPEEKANFDRIMDRIVNGWYMQHKRVDKEVKGQISHFEHATGFRMAGP